MLVLGLKCYSHDTGAAILSDEGQLPSYFNAPKHCPFMNIAGFVLEQGLVEVPAVVHADRSCRIQTVSPTHNNGYHSLINEFGHITGCPVLLNTSFND